MTSRGINWIRAVLGAIAAEILQIAAAFGWVAIYSHLIDPGRPMEVYEAHAAASGPWVSIVAGGAIFYAASRWIARNVATALALFGVFFVIDGALLLAMAGGSGPIPWLLAAASYASKAALCWLGGRHGEARAV
jgi:hypothetical protein